MNITTDSKFEVSVFTNVAVLSSKTVCTVAACGWKPISRPSCNCTWKNMPMIAIIALHKAEAQWDWKVEGKLRLQVSGSSAITI